MDMQFIWVFNLIFHWENTQSGSRTNSDIFCQVDFQHCLKVRGFCFFVSPRINISGEKPRDRSWHTLTPIGDDRLFLFGGLSSDNVPLSK